ncbi:TPA: hypothetical protein PC505_001050 [Morganella morganii]|nr:hypothetical protein [Morganella morganii]HAT1527748.1 hypothetical protein [Morganella morganii]HDF2363896.1 hypothetical protein [Morganella morganii]HDF2421678.1 hypothetical protein [Morganella morganii]
MDKSLQQFEEYIKLHTDPKELEQKLKRENDGLSYANNIVNLMWIGWQASRDAMKPVGYTSHKELQEIKFGDGGLVHLNKCFSNYMPVYIND